MISQKYFYKIIKYKNNIMSSEFLRRGDSECPKCGSNVISTTNSWPIIHCKCFKGHKWDFNSHTKHVELTTPSLIDEVEETIKYGKYARKQYKFANVLFCSILIIFLLFIIFVDKSKGINRYIYVCLLMALIVSAIFAITAYIDDVYDMDNVFVS